MVNINLLPWRTLQRDYQIRVIKRFFLVTCLLNGVIGGLVYCILLQYVQKGRVRLTKLEAQYEQHARWNQSGLSVNKQVDHFLFLRPMVNYRAMTGQLFEQIESSRGGSLCFTEINRNNQEIIFSGKVYSVMELIAYLRYWQALPFVSSIKIIYLHHLRDNWLFRFAAAEHDFFSGQFKT